MPPAPPAARRLPPLGCVLVAAVALLLPGCGSGGGATSENTATPPASQERSGSAGSPRAATSSPCPAQLGSFVESLDTLRRQLAIGLSYDQYTAKVKALRAAYDRLPIDRLDLHCLTSTGTPSEGAFDKYTDAANAWGECLADASCDTSTIEPVLQRKWRIASHFLSEAQ
jgi:hypothetical protein